MTKQIEEYRLSDSSTSITGSGDGYDWAGTMPTVPPGKYLWKRLKSYFSNGSIAYSDAICDVDWYSTLIKPQKLLPQKFGSLILLQKSMSMMARQENRLEIGLPKQKQISLGSTLLSQTFKLMSPGKPMVRLLPH